jgi:predicted GNAT superfamily acetyltransferase
MGAADLERVLELNEESVNALSPLDLGGVQRHQQLADVSVVWDIGGDAVGFAFAFAPGSTYESVNYRWHGERFADFLYLDRIAVSSRARRTGIGSKIYDYIEALAAEHGRMVCEVNSDPPNEESLAFHERRGYRPVGTLRQPDGHETVMLEKPL